MRKIDWQTPNKMKIHTGHTAFDRQTNALGTGNYIANTLVGWYIRPYSETWCNGFTFPPGHLMNFDLDGFRHARIPESIKKILTDPQRKDSAILYMVFHYNGSRQVVHGWVLTDGRHNLIRKMVTGPTYKSYNIISTVTEYIANVEEKAA